MSLSITIEKSGGNIVVSSADIAEFSYVTSCSPDGDTVQSDEISVIIRQSPDDWRQRWNGVNKGSAVWITTASRVETAPGWITTVTRREKYFFKPPVRRLGRDRFQITAQSPVGRLVSDFPGGLYAGQRLTDVLRDVIGGIVPFDCDSRLASVRVRGWAPYQSRRETLHALAFAYGFHIRRDENQNLYFAIPAESSYNILKSSIFAGGSVDYRVGDAYARIDVAAKDFYKDHNAQDKTLFDNSSGGAPADSLTIIFPSPMYDLTTSGTLTIDETLDEKKLCGVNYAVVSGLGTLSGKPYAVSESVVSADGDPDADPANVLTVSDAPFITALNAVSVAEKLRSSRSAELVTMDILRSNQRPGDRVEFTDPFGDEQSGYIVSLSGSITSVDRATATVLCGYAPTWGATYDSVLILDGSEPDYIDGAGIWTVPDCLDGKTVRMILIGGGQGGASGQHGTDNATIGGQTVEVGGSGHGAPGHGGKFREVRLTLRAGEQYAYQCGAGGAGGVPTDEMETPDEEDGKGPYYLTTQGADGGNTTFVPYPSGDGWSSGDGWHSAAGFYDAIRDTLYALPGPDNGVDGGAATSGRENGNRSDPAYETVTKNSVTLPLEDVQNWTYDGQIYDSESWTSGDAGNGAHYHQDRDEDYPALDEWGYGGLGGGAAVGNNGGAGFNAATGDRGGDGGDGADALPIFPENARAYGSGGSGGHGGGEGGKGGSGNTTAVVLPSYDRLEGVPGATGTGGSGSAGQDGAPGCILIYFHS